MNSLLCIDPVPESGAVFLLYRGFAAVEGQATTHRSAIGTGFDLVKTVTDCTKIVGVLFFELLETIVGFFNIITELVMYYGPPCTG